MKASMHACIYIYIAIFSGISILMLTHVYTYTSKYVTNKLSDHGG